MLIQYLINVKPLCVAYAPRPDEVIIVRYVQPLTDEQCALLEKTMKEDTAFRARSRAHSLLLSAGGTPIQTIAKTYQVHRVTVSAWIKKWEQHGAQSLHDRPRRYSLSTISKKTLVRQRGCRAISQQNGEAPQYFVAETSSKKSPSSMEAGEEIAQKPPRPGRLCQGQTCT